MAENKSELKVEDEADYTENIDPEYKNYSSVARKPFATKDDKKGDDKQVQSESAKTPTTPKAPSADNK